MTTDATPETFSEQPKNLIRMDSAMKGACGFVGWENGSLYIELYDHSESANNAFGNDVATMWRISPQHLPELIAHVPTTNHQVIEEAALPTFLSTHFSTIEQVITWLDGTKVPVSKTFDSWA